MENNKYHHFIRVKLLWEGELSSSDLTHYFDCSRQTAQSAISRFKSQYPNLLKYDSTNKTHQLKSQEITNLGDIDFNDYVQLSTYLAQPHIVTPLQLPQRHIKPKVVRAIIKAIKKQHRIDIGYRSVSSNEFEERIIAPHHLVFDGQRYHVRAYCEKRAKFLDFVLSRFDDSYIQEEGKSKNTVEHDTVWQQIIKVELIPNPELSANQQQIIAQDYGMQNNQLIIECRAALVGYLLQRLRLDQTFENPQAQQIVLSPSCEQGVRQWQIK